MIGSLRSKLTNPVSVKVKGKSIDRAFSRQSTASRRNGLDLKRPSSCRNSLELSAARLSPENGRDEPVSRSSPIEIPEKADIGIPVFDDAFSKAKPALRTKSRSTIHLVARPLSDPAPFDSPLKEGCTLPSMHSTHLPLYDQGFPLYPIRRDVHEETENQLACEPATNTKYIPPSLPHNEEENQKTALKIRDSNGRLQKGVATSSAKTTLKPSKKFSPLFKAKHFSDAMSKLDEERSVADDDVKQESEGSLCQTALRARAIRNSQSNSSHWSSSGSESQSETSSSNLKHFFGSSVHHLRHKISMERFSFDSDKVSKSSVTKVSLQQPSVEIQNSIASRENDTLKQAVQLQDVASPTNSKPTANSAHITQELIEELSEGSVESAEDRNVEIIMTKVKSDDELCDLPEDITPNCTEDTGSPFGYALQRTEVHGAEARESSDAAREKLRVFGPPRDSARPAWPCRRGRRSLEQTPDVATTWGHNRSSTETSRVSTSFFEDQYGYHPRKIVAQSDTHHPSPTAVSTWGHPRGRLTDSSHENGSPTRRQVHRSSGASVPTRRRLRQADGTLPGPNYEEIGSQYESAYEPDLGTTVLPHLGLNGSARGRRRNISSISSTSAD